MIVNGVLVKSMKHLRSLCVGMDQAASDSLIAMYAGVDLPEKSEGAAESAAHIAEGKIDKMLKFNDEIRKELIAGNITLGISKVTDGRGLADAAFGPVFDEISRLKYPEALYKLAVLKADTSKHFGQIITKERIDFYYNKIIQFLGSL